MVFAGRRNRRGGGVGRTHAATRAQAEDADARRRRGATRQTVGCLAKSLTGIPFPTLIERLVVFVFRSRDMGERYRRERRHLHRQANGRQISPPPRRSPSDLRHRLVARKLQARSRRAPASRDDDDVADTRRFADSEDVKPNIRHEKIVVKVETDP